MDFHSKKLSRVRSILTPEEKELIKEWRKKAKKEYRNHAVLTCRSCKHSWRVKQLTNDDIFGRCPGCARYTCKRIDQPPLRRPKRIKPMRAIEASRERNEGTVVTDEFELRDSECSPDVHSDAE